VAEFCEMKKFGLGPWSEQASESVHHDFQLVWENYKVKNIHHIDYGSKLYQALCVYNSRHLL
jgi:hypothetical protein